MGLQFKKKILDCSPTTENHDISAVDISIVGGEAVGGSIRRYKSSSLIVSDSNNINVINKGFNKSYNIIR
jgi:hypothetical protein